MKWKKLPSSKQEPMWKSEDGRFLISTQRQYTNRDGKKSYTLLYMVTERDASGKLKKDLGEAKNLAAAKRLIQAGELMLYSYDRRTEEQQRADLTPPLGWPGGSCHVVQRIDQEVRNPRLKEQLRDKAETGKPLSNPEAAKVYDLEPERGAGLVRQLVIGIHAQYRMDLRQVTVPQVRVALKSFSKTLNDYKSQKHPKYHYYSDKIQRSQPIEWLDQRLNLTIIFVFVGAYKAKLMSAWWQGEPDPAPSRCTLAEQVSARWLTGGRVRWKSNRAEGKYTQAEITKGSFGWVWEVTTNFKRTMRSTGTSVKTYLDDDGTVYKADAKEAAEEAMAKWDREIAAAGGPEKWAETW